MPLVQGAPQPPAYAGIRSRARAWRPCLAPSCPLPCRYWPVLLAWLLLVAVRAIASPPRHASASPPVRLSRARAFAPDRHARASSFAGFVCRQLQNSLADGRDGSGGSWSWQVAAVMGPRRPQGASAGVQRDAVSSRPRRPESSSPHSTHTSDNPRFRVVGYTVARAPTSGRRPR